MAKCAVCGKQSPFCEHTTRNPELRGVGRGLKGRNATSGFGGHLASARRKAKKR